MQCAIRVRAAVVGAGLMLTIPQKKSRQRTSSRVVCESWLSSWWCRQTGSSKSHRPEVSSILASTRPAAACIFGIKEASAQKFCNGRSAKASEVAESDVTFLGSGFAYGGGSFVATCAHLFDSHGSEGVMLLRFGDGSWHRAFVWAISPSSDIAVLRIDDETSSRAVRGLPLKISQELPSQGEWVLVLGAPQHGRESVCLVGLVSQPSQTLRGGLAEEAGVKLVQLAVPTLPGMSGSPVLNLKGEVVAMLAKKFEEHGLALPGRHVARVVYGLEEHRCWRPPVLGLELEPAGSLAEPAVNVRRVVENGPSAVVGICAGDRVLAVGQEKVHSVLDVRSALGGLGGAGATAVDSVQVRLLLERDGRAFEATVCAIPS